MKILVATGLYAPEVGGPATHTALMEKYLPARGIEIRVVPFRLVRHLPPLFRHAAFALRLCSRALRSDVIFSQDAVSCGLPALFVSKLFFKPFIVRVPGDFAWEQGKLRFGVQESLDEFRQKKYGTRVELFRRAQTFVARHADVVIVASAYFAEVVAEWGVPRERIRVIHNGIELPDPHPRPALVPPYVVFTAGRLVPGKGYAELIDIVSEMPDWTLRIAGDGPLRESLAQRIASASSGSRVSLLGFLTREKLSEQYGQSHAFVLNSESESFSYQVLEAMAAGIPVIATRVGAIPEILEDGREGVLVKPNDANAIRASLQSVITEPQLWQRRTQAAVGKARTFGADVTADKLAGLFLSVV